MTIEKGHAFHCGELIINPKWTVSFIPVGGGLVPVMAFDHPRHGQLTFEITREGAQFLSGWMAEVAQGKTPDVPVGPTVVPFAPHRLGVGDPETA